MDSASKLIQIITSNSLETRIKKIFKQLDIRSYTFFSVNGEGDTGMQTGHFDADSNVLFMVVLDEDRLKRLVEDINKDNKKGYHHFVFSMNAELHSPT